MAQSDSRNKINKITIEYFTADVQAFSIEQHKNSKIEKKKKARSRFSLFKPQYESDKKKVLKEKFRFFPQVFTTLSFGQNQ